MKSATRALCAAALLCLAACSGDEHTVAPDPAGCVDFSFYIHFESSVAVGGTARRTARDGRFLYAAAGEAGVRVIDLFSSPGPEVAASIDTPGFAGDVAVAGSLLFVADGSSGLRIVSILDPTQPEPLGVLDTAGEARGVAVQGSTVYVTDDVGLRVVNARNPLSPFYVGGDNTPGRAIDIALLDGFAFVSDVELGLRVIPVVPPTSYEPVALLPLPGEAGGVDGENGRIYVACGTAGVCVIDARRPSRPAILNVTDTPGIARDVSVEGNRLYVAESGGVLVYGIDRSADLRLLTTVVAGEEALGVEVAGARAFASCGANGIRAIDASNPNPPPVLSSLALPGGASGVFLVGGAVYACGGTGVRVIDASDPQVPRIAAELSSSAAARCIAAGRGVAYVAAGTGQGIRRFDVRDPFAPVELSRMTAGADRLGVNDSLLVLAQGFAGIQVYRIDGAGPPVFESTLQTGDLVFDAVLEDGCAYVANNRSLLVVDVTDPTLPRVRSELPLEGVCRGVAAGGGRVLVAAGNSGVHAVDVGDPSAPVFLGTARTPGFVSHVAPAGETIYASGEWGGVQILDGRSAVPVFLGTFNGAGTSLVSASDGVLLFAADRETGLVITRAQCAGR